MYKLILTTTDSIQTVNTISDYLLNTKLSPCVQILNNLDSRYFWEGKIQSHNEYLLFIKCHKKDTSKISDYIKNNHNYEVAEINETDLNILNDRYKRWFDNITN